MTGARSGIIGGLAYLWLLLAMTSPARAEVIILTNPNQFSGTETLLTFQGVQPFENVTSFGGVGFQLVGSPPGTGISGAIDLFNPREFGPQEGTILNNFLVGAPDLQMTFPAPINRLGFELRNSVVTSGEITLSLFSSGSLVEAVTLPFRPGTAYFFYGVESASPFDQVVLRGPGATDRRFGLDNLRFEGTTVIPEPSALTLLSLGCLGLAAYRMRAWAVTCSAALLLLLSGAGSPAARGGIIVFDNEPDFLGAAPVVSTERFDAFPPGTVLGIGSATVDGITYSAANPAAVWATAAILITPSPPNHFQTMNDPGPFETLTFGEGGLTDAVGFFLIPPSVSSVYRVTATTAGGEQVTETLFTNGVLTYRGYVAEEGIRSVTIEPVLFGGGISNVFFDNVSRGGITPVPEPSALALLGLGSIGLLSYYRRRTRTG